MILSDFGIVDDNFKFDATDNASATVKFAYS